MMSYTDYTPTAKSEISVEEVEKEEIFVKNKLPSDIPVRVNTLRKTYGKVVAVDKISFGLEYGECFALLGVSGAGKTNCFKCLTGETKPTSGEVTINGHDVTTTAGFMKARK
jgi:ABC-type multidrug transport system ATPase subunit